MNRPSLILSCGIFVFLLTLFWLPVRSTYHIGEPIQTVQYQSTKSVWELTPYDSIRFDEIGVIWAALFVVTGGVWRLASK